MNDDKPGDWTLEELEGAKDKDIVVMLNEYQDMVDELQRQLANPTYSHRNGESEPPTVYGWYWIGYPLSYVHRNGETYYEMHDLRHRYSDNQLEWDDGDWQPTGNDMRYYGPIPQPKGD